MNKIEDDILLLLDIVKASKSLRNESQVMINRINSLMTRINVEKEKCPSDRILTLLEINKSKKRMAVELKHKRIMEIKEAGDTICRLREIKRGNSKKCHHTVIENYLKTVGRIQ